jgi:hypothetical protein
VWSAETLQGERQIIRGQRLMSKEGLKRRHHIRNTYNVIITMLNDMDGFIPLFGFGKLNVKRMDKVAVNYLGVAIRLGMEGSRMF